MTTNRDEVIIDACCIINLYATSVFADILESFPATFYISKYVRNDEALKIKKSIKEPYQYVTIDIVPFIQSGVLEEIELQGEDEIRTFVDFAANIDDGEAICGSLALHRDLHIATDDKAAINLFNSYSTPIPTLSTLELLKNWVEISSIEPKTIRKTLKEIEIRACYIPNQSHKNYDWWKKYR